GGGNSRGRTSRVRCGGAVVGERRLVLDREDRLGWASECSAAGRVGVAGPAEGHGQLQRAGEGGAPLVRARVPARTSEGVRPQPLARVGLHLTIKPRPLYVGIPCRLVVRADWISDLAQPPKTMTETYRAVFVPRTTTPTTTATTTSTTTTTPTTTTIGTTTTAPPPPPTTTSTTTTSSTTTTTTPADVPPTAVDDSYSTDEDAALTVSAPGVLANDSDPDSSTITAVLVSGPSHGTLILNADGSFIYAPAANFNGPDSFTYKANDGTADSNTATVSITVNAVNDAPVSVNDTYSTHEDT